MTVAASSLGPVSNLTFDWYGGRLRISAPGVVRRGELHFREGEGSSFRPGDAVLLCVRPHAVQVRPGGPYPAGDNNGVSGQLVQQAYLGDLQDLRIALPGGLEVRALAPSGQHYRIGEEVVVQPPQEACRLVRS